MGATRETEWPIVLQHESPPRSARSRVDKPSCEQCPYHFLRKDQGKFKTLQHYRPYGYINIACSGLRTVLRRPVITYAPAPPIGVLLALSFFACGATVGVASARDTAAIRSGDEAGDLQQGQRRVAAADSEGPSDKDIIDLSKERLRKDALQSLAREYGNLDQMAPGALNQLQAMAPATAGPILSCTLNAPREKTACINRAKSELIAERDARRAQIQKVDFGAFFVFAVKEKTNYEGNYVAIVNVRKRGSDQAWQWKLLLQSKNGSWIIADKSEKEIR